MKHALFLLLMLLPMSILCQNTNLIKAKFGKNYSQILSKDRPRPTTDTLTQDELKQIEKILFVKNNEIIDSCNLISCRILWLPRRGESFELIINRDSLKNNESYLSIIESAGYGSKIYIDYIEYGYKGISHKLSGQFQIYISETSQHDPKNLLKSEQSFR